MTALGLSKYLVYLWICTVTCIDIHSDEYIEDKAPIDILSESLDDGFTTIDGVEIEAPKHWINKEESTDTSADLSPGTPVSSIHGWTWTKESSIPKLYVMDPETKNTIRRKVKYALYSAVNCTGFKSKVSNLREKLWGEQLGGPN